MAHSALRKYVSLERARGHLWVRFHIFLSFAVRVSYGSTSSAYPYPAFTDCLTYTRNIIQQASFYSCVE